MLRKTMGPIVVACLVLVACQDTSAPTPVGSLADANESEGRGDAKHIVGIGTSITAGYCSDGLVGWCQSQSYFAQLIRMMHREPTLPLVSEFGCKSPFAVPLISFKRTSGESVATSNANLSCAANEPGVVLGTQNLAVEGARTLEALVSRPIDQTDPFRSQVYRRILPVDATQVSAFESMKPKLGIIELGANDFMGIHTGIVIVGGSIVPFATWSAQYNQVLDRAGAVAPKMLLVGLGRGVAKLPSLRRATEIWADRAAFLSAFNVEVNANCDGSQNLIVVPALVPAAVAQGLGRRAAGAPPFVFSCAAGAGTVQDRILTPDEETVADAALEQMNNHIRDEAIARGYAHVELEALYGLPKPPFSVVNVMTTATPYGPNISLDGLHPSAAGHTIIAQAALRAINDRYDIGVDGTLLGISTSPSRTP